MDPSASAGQGSEGVDPIQYQTTVAAYYQSVVGRAPAARSRAQAGFAIVSAISGFVIAAAFTTQIDHAPDYTKWPAFVGVGFWVLAAGLFLRASIVQPRPKKGEKGEEEAKKAAKDVVVPLSKSAFVDYVPRIANQEARRVNFWVVLAGYSTTIALALTMATVATVVFFPPGPNQVTADVTVTEPYFQQFLAQCQVTVTDPEFHDLIGTLDVDSLDSDFVALNIEPGLCVGKGELEIPQSAVLQIEEYPQCSSSDLRIIEGAPLPSTLGSKSTLEFVKPAAIIVSQGSRSATPSPSASTGEPLPRIYPVSCPYVQPIRSIFRRKSSTDPR